MIKYFLQIALRSLTKNKVFSFINITGLSVGMSVALLTGIWIWSELSFNKYHEHYDRIAQVMQSQTSNGGINTSEYIPFPLATELSTKNGSDFKLVVLSSATWNHILSSGDKHFVLTGNYMQPSAPDLLSLKMLSGNRSGLNDVYSILLSASAAKSLFGNADPINRVIKLDNKQDVRVRGVFENIPQNSSFSELTFIAPWNLYKMMDENVGKLQNDWGYNAYKLFVQLADQVNFKNVSQKIRNAKLNNVDVTDVKYHPVVLLHPMSRWHLYSEFKNGINSGGEISYVWIFGLIGILVLTLACINFMNLSTAGSEKRAREVGVRKAIGSSRSQLIGQFLFESTAMAFLAFLLSLLIVSLVLPVFSQIAGKDMEIPRANPLFWMVSIAFTGLTGLLAGIYPAFYLSSFQAAKVLKGNFKTGKAGTMPRKILVIGQFTVSIVLVTGTVAALRQLKYSQDRPVGYDRARLITMEMNSPRIHDHFQAFREDLIKSRAIVDMTESGSSTTGIYGGAGDIKWQGKDPNMNDEFSTIGINHSYGKTIGWKIKEGRDFSAASVTDSTGMIVNEAAVAYMGLKNPVGQIIDWWGKQYHIIGVAENMIMRSPYEGATQSLFFIDRQPGNFVIMKLNPDIDQHASLQTIGTVWKKYSPDEPFDFKFADLEYQKKFFTEQKVQTLAGIFSSLAIFISCIGLFGMALFVASHRVKEIGMRKVLGASVLNVWALLNKEFIILVGIAICISIPVTYYLVDHWLQQYPYHTNLPWWLFLSTALGAMSVTLLTVSYQSIRTALTNPVNSLRSE
jgi:putative ABC transport system permease protein